MSGTRTCVACMGTGKRMALGLRSCIGLIKYNPCTRCKGTGKVSD